MLAAVRRYLELDAQEAVVFAVSLAVAVARDLDEEALWLMIVGPPGSGKTEGIALCKLAADGRVDELTRAGLLSWSSLGKKTRRTGLLTRIPPVAFVTISDFSTVVTMGDREARARMFGALRVIYDGRLYRSIGGQPAGEGDELEWEGHLTLLAAATPAVDTHFSFEAALGERWLLFRLEEDDYERATTHARYVVDREEVGPLREKAQELAAALIRHARGLVPQHLSEKSKTAIVDVAYLAAHARTGVQFEGTGKYRVPIGYPTPEVPTRLAGQMNRLARCLVALGIAEELAVRIAIQAARDSIPLARRKARERGEALGRARRHAREARSAVPSPRPHSELSGRQRPASCAGEADPATPNVIHPRLRGRDSGEGVSMPTRVVRDSVVADGARAEDGELPVLLDERRVRSRRPAGNGLHDDEAPIRLGDRTLQDPVLPLLKPERHLLIVLEGASRGNRRERLSSPGKSQSARQEEDE